MSDFSTLLQDYVDERTEHARSVAPDPAVEARALASRVRRKRAGRVGVAAGAAAAVVVVAAAGVFAATRPDVVPPAETSVPTVSPTPSESPSAEEEEPAPQALGPVSTLPGLPAAQPLLEGMIEDAGPGWSLAQVELRDTAGSFIYLKDPAGTLYEVPVPAGDAVWRDGQVMEWLPRTPLVLAWPWHEDGTRVVDVVTGETLLTIPDALEGHDDASGVVEFVGDGTTDVLVHWTWGDLDGPGAAGDRIVRLATDGTVVASFERELPDVRGFSGARISPDGSRVVLDGVGVLPVLSTDDLREVSTPASPLPIEQATCSPDVWLDDDAFLVDCTDAEGSGSQLYIVHADSGEATPLYDDHGGMPAKAWVAGNGLVVGHVQNEDAPEPDAPSLDLTALYRCGWDGVCEDDPFTVLPDRQMASIADGLLHTEPVRGEAPAYGGTYSVTDLTSGSTSTVELGPDASFRMIVPFGAHRASFGMMQ